MNNIQTLSLRGAVWEDAFFLLSLRNDPSVRSQSIQNQIVSLEEHEAWFKKTLQKLDVKLYIVLLGENPVGQVRYDIHQDIALISIALLGDYRGKGFGKTAIKLLIEKITLLKEVKTLKALIKDDNKASIECFRKLGFLQKAKEQHGNSLFIVMELTNSNPQVFLVTTALEDFWDTSKPLVFLNSGCSRYSRKDFWGKLEHQTMVHPFKDHKNYEEAYQFVSDFYEEVLPLISERLNQVHGSNESPRFWRIIIGIWLIQCIHILYERYVALREAFSKYPELITWVMDEKDYVTAKSFKEMTSWIVDDRFNFQLYSQLLKAMGKEFPAYRVENSLNSAQTQGFKSRVKDVIGGMVRQMAKYSPVFIRYPFFPTRADKWKLFYKTGGKSICDIETDDQFRFMTKNVDLRNQLKDLSIQGSEFAKIFKEIWSDALPLCYLEGFKDQLECAKKLYSFTPKSIVTSVGFYYDETFKFWSASCANEGTKLCGTQHGGNYGLCSPNAVEDHERKITDIYYSWGWVGEKVRPMPATKYLGLKTVVNPGSKEGILFSSKRFSRYLIWFDHDRPYDDLDYLEDQMVFMSALPQAIRQQIRLRLFRDDCGSDLKQRWNDFDAMVVLEDWTESFMQSMHRRRFHVTNYPVSTFVDSLTLNMPTILFWPQDRYKIREDGKRYIQGLRDVGILHETPQEAARLVAENYDHVEEWWYQKNLQAAVQTFVERYGRRSPSGFDLWAAELNSLV